MNPMMAAKIAVFAQKHWKGIAAGIFGLLLFIVFIPSAAIIAFFPSATDTQKIDYKNVATDFGIDYSDLLAYDTVKSGNNFEDADPIVSAYDFIKLSFTEYKDYETLYLDDNNEVQEKTLHMLYRNVTVNSYAQMVSLLQSLGYDTSSGNMDFSDVTTFLDGLNHRYYTYSYVRLSIDDLMARFNDEQKQYAFELLTQLQGISESDPGTGQTPEPTAPTTFSAPTLPGYSITSPFGMRVHPVTHIVTMHDGIDLAKANCLGDPVMAIADGVVTEVNMSNGEAGHYVRISHKIGNDEWQSRYCHLSTVLVKVGQTVTKGMTIANVGATGRVTGPHLHLELKLNGALVDPAKYVSY